MGSGLEKNGKTNGCKPTLKNRKACKIIWKVRRQLRKKCEKSVDKYIFSPPKSRGDKNFDSAFDKVAT